MKILIIIFLLTFSTFAQIDNSNFERIFQRETIAEKKEIWFTLSNSEKVEVRRRNFEWAASKINLTANQQDYLSRLSNKLPTITSTERDEFQAEALELFTKTQGTLLFGTIGPYELCSVFTRANFQPTNCPCSIGSKFNMSCDGSCGYAGGLCSTTPEGCGFAWLYSCNGVCVVN